MPSIATFLLHMTRKKTAIFIGVTVLFLYNISSNFNEYYETGLQSPKSARNLTNMEHLGVTKYVNVGKQSPSLNVLSLGGSTTYGYPLKKRETEAYPYLIGPSQNSVVINLAVRATGSDYASQCIQSMVEEALETNDLPLDFNFHVITVEYSLNGLDGLQLLLLRLRRRYPKAKIVYVHLWSLRMSVKDDVTNTFPRHILNQPNIKKLSQADVMINQALENPQANWIWDEPTFDVSNDLLNQVQSILHSIAGDTYIWSLPRAKIPKNMFSWFSSKDRHHLSDIGHAKVAQGIQSYLQMSSQGQKAVSSNNNNVHNNNIQNDGTWGLGDQCISWFQDGTSSFAEHSKNIKMFVKPDKWALHISQDDGIVTTKFSNKAKWNMPLSLTHMAWRNPSIYPKTRITVSSLPKHNHDQEFTTVLNPLHRNEAFHIYHVTQTTFIGTVLPGEHIISMEATEMTERPLRLTGIVMCGACMEMNTDGKDKYY